MGYHITVCHVFKAYSPLASGAESFLNLKWNETPRYKFLSIKVHLWFLFYFKTCRNWRRLPPLNDNRSYSLSDQKKIWLKAYHLYLSIVIMHWWLSNEGLTIGTIKCNGVHKSSVNTEILFQIPLIKIYKDKSSYHWLF